MTTRTLKYQEFLNDLKETFPNQIIFTFKEFTKIAKCSIMTLERAASQREFIFTKCKNKQTRFVHRNDVAKWLAGIRND